MATYYVRKTGSDGAAGTSAGTAWQTIDKAANTVAASDTVYVGAGTYRELVTMDTSGSSGNQISFIADVTGENTGDPGLVVISAFTNSNTASRSSCWDPDGRTFVTVRGFVMQGGTSGVVWDINATDQNFEGVVFEDCVFVAGPDNIDAAFTVDMNGASSPASSGLTVRRCVFSGGGLRIQWNQNATAEQNLKVVVEGCLFAGAAASSLYVPFFWDMIGTSSFGCGGVTFRNNTIHSSYVGVVVDHGTSTTYPVAVSNCLIIADSSALQKATSNDGALTSSYNTYTGTNTNVTAGTGDRNETSTWLLGGIADMPLYRFLGWSPYRPWEPMRPYDDTDWTSLIGDATTSPTFDLYNELRPMHGTAADRGAVEGRARMEKETTTVRTGSNAGRFDGAGFHDMLFPVTATSTTVSVYARKDANYTGTAPQLKVMNIPGVADQTDTHTVAAGNWEELTATFTPTSAGVARIRLISNDTSATGTCYFDDLTVT